jgi:hypothetical protein
MQTTEIITDISGGNSKPMVSATDIILAIAVVISRKVIQDIS